MLFFVVALFEVNFEVKMEQENQTMEKLQHPCVGKFASYRTSSNVR
jgi:hypothetical protein